MIPLQQKGAGNEVVTQFPMNDVEALGLLKMDFLGLRNLDVIDKAVALIGDGLDIEQIPMDERRTYEMLARGEATGVFQFESSGMREALRQVKPTEFEDLIALVALYRPGPMQYIPNYAARKAGKERVVFIDRRLEPITGSTYGISIYQEQSMEIAKQVAGFTPAEADDLRKAIGKKIHALMASLKDKFIEGCIANETSEQVARQLWDDIEKSQDYSFNKSHAACYALIAYQTAWLRANHPCEYMAALISSVMNTKDKVPFYVNACDEMGIEVLPPDVNSSQVDFAVVEGKIRFGLNAVKGVGEGAAAAIVRAREEAGPFASVWDFTERVDGQVSNKRVLEALVKCGALDSVGHSRKGMLEVLEQAVAWGQGRQADRLLGQASIFDLGDAVEAQPKHHPSVPADEFEKPELLKLEKEVLGLYVSEHPLTQIRDQLRRKTDCSLNELDRRRDGEVVTVGGIVAGVKQLTTKKGEPMVFLTLEDVTGSAECVVFASVYAQARELCTLDRIVVAKARIDRKEGESKLLALELQPFEAVSERREVRLRIDTTKAPAGIVGDLRRLIGDFPGESPVVVTCVRPSGPALLEFGPGFKVQPDPDFFAEVKALARRGRDRVAVRCVLAVPASSGHGDAHRVSRNASASPSAGSPAPASSGPSAGAARTRPRRPTAPAGTRTWPRRRRPAPRSARPRRPRPRGRRPRRRSRRGRPPPGSVPGCGPSARRGRWRRRARPRARGPRPARRADGRRHGSSRASSCGSRAASARPPSTAASRRRRHRRERRSRSASGAAPGSARSSQRGPRLQAALALRPRPRLERRPLELGASFGDPVDELHPVPERDGEPCAAEQRLEQRHVRLLGHAGNLAGGDLMESPRW